MQWNSMIYNTNPSRQSASFLLIRLWICSIHSVVHHFKVAKDLLSFLPDFWWWRRFKLWQHILNHVAESDFFNPLEEPIGYSFNRPMYNGRVKLVMVIIFSAITGRLKVIWVSSASSSWVISYEKLAWMFVVEDVPSSGSLLAAQSFSDVVWALATVL